MSTTEEKQKIQELIHIEFADLPEKAKFKVNDLKIILDDKYILTSPHYFSGFPLNKIHPVYVRRKKIRTLKNARKYTLEFYTK